MLKVYSRRLGDALLPPRCILCGCDTPDALLCTACSADLPWNTPACPGCALPSTGHAPCPACLKRPRAFDAAFAAFVLAPPVQQGIHALKYQARFQQAALLSAAAASALRQRAANRCRICSSPSRCIGGGSVGAATTSRWSWPADWAER